MSIIILIHIRKWCRRSQVSRRFQWTPLNACARQPHQVPGLKLGNSPYYGYQNTGINWGTTRNTQTRTKFVSNLSYREPNSESYSSRAHSDNRWATEHVKYYYNNSTEYRYYLPMVKVKVHNLRKTCEVLALCQCVRLV